MVRPIAPAATLLAVTLIGCGSAGDARPAGSEGGTVEVLEVACSEDGLDVSAHRVEVGASGVRLEVTALPDDGTTIELAGPDGAAFAGPPAGVHAVGPAVVDRVPPGEALLRCYPDDGERHFLTADADPEAVTIEIVDGDGHWRDPGALACPSGVVEDTVVDAAPEPAPGDAEEDLEEVAARHIGTPRDALVVGGYADAAARWVSAVRDDRVVALASYRQHGAGWQLDAISACAEG